VNNADFFPLLRIVVAEGEFHIDGLFATDGEICGFYNRKFLPLASLIIAYDVALVCWQLSANFILLVDVDLGHVFPDTGFMIAHRVLHVAWGDTAGPEGWVIELPRLNPNALVAKWVLQVFGGLKNAVVMRLSIFHLFCNCLSDLTHSFFGHFLKVFFRDLIGEVIFLLCVKLDCLDSASEQCQQESLSDHCGFFYFKF